MDVLNTCLNCGQTLTEDERAEHKCIVCPVCFKILKTHDDYVTHLEIFKCRPVELCDSCGSPSENRDDVCMGCVDLYLQNRTVERHKRVRYVDHTFMCERCGSSFSRTCVLVKDGSEDEQEMENKDPQPLYGYHVIIIVLLFLIVYYSIITFL